MKPLETTPKDVLREAIQHEVASRAFLQSLAERVTDPAGKKKIIELSDRELVHRARLERRYREVVGEPPPPTEDVKVEFPPDLQNLDLRRALKIALERERESESNYRFLAERVPNTELGSLFLELAENEWKHKVEIQNDYDLIAGDQFLMDI